MANAASMAVAPDDVVRLLPTATGAAEPGRAARVGWVCCLGEADDGERQTAHVFWLKDDVVDRDEARPPSPFHAPLAPRPTRDAAGLARNPPWDFYGGRPLIQLARCRT